MALEMVSRCFLQELCDAFEDVRVVVVSKVLGYPLGVTGSEDFLEEVEGPFAVPKNCVQPPFLRFRRYQSAQP